MRNLPLEQIFTADAAYAQGWTSSALRNAVRHGRLWRVRRGVYASAGQRGPVVAALAAARNYPAVVVSHRSAALLHGLPLLGAQPPQAEMTVRPRANANLPAVHVHRAQLRPEDIAVVDGVAITSVARTVIDLARHRPISASVAAIDAALQRRLTTLEEIGDVLKFCWNWPRIRQAHRAVRLSDGRAESPLESLSRLVIGWLGLPQPQLQQVICARSGHPVGRLDFYWDEFGVGGEADGRSKYDGRDVLTAEKDRQEALEDLAIPIARWGWTHVSRQRYSLRAKIEAAFERGSRRDRSGFPRLWTL